MSAGDNAPVEQVGAPAAGKANQPAKSRLWGHLQTLWSFIKPVWWMRGVLSAIALVALLDSIGIGRGWLRIPHAISARWHEWMHLLGDFIRKIMPFEVDYQPQELTLIAFTSAIILPAIVPFFFDKGPWMGFPTKWTSALNDITRATMFLFVSSLIVIAIGFGGAGDSTAVAHPIDPTAELPDGTRELARIGLTLGMLAVMALFNWRYFVVMVIVLTFIATLEVFYHVPIIDEWVAKLADVIDPQPSVPATPP